MTSPPPTHEHPEDECDIAGKILTGNVTPSGDDEAVLDDLVPARVEAAHTGASPERLAELEAKIARAVHRSRAPATLRAYRSDWADFVTWCAGVGLDALGHGRRVRRRAGRPTRRPPTPSGVDHHPPARRHRRRPQGGRPPNPCTDPLVRETMKGIRRMLGVARIRKKAVATGDLRAVTAGLGDRPIDHRDRLLLLLGYAGGLRRSELVALEVHDAEPHPDGLLLTLRSSKTDQEGAGRRVEIVYGTDPLPSSRSPSPKAGTTSSPATEPTGPTASSTTPRWPS